MRGPFADRLRAGKPIVLDGAMGTALLAMGTPPGLCPEALNLSHPDWIAGVHRGYLQAGADLLLANTFGASPLKLAPYGLEPRTEEINLRAVNLLRDAAKGRVWLGASIGPSGRLLLPHGDADPAEVKAGFRRQARALALAGVDAFVVETMTDLAEALLALEACREAAPGIPVLVTLTFDETPRGHRTLMGQSVDRCAEALERAGADAVGSNCGIGIESMVAVARRFREATALPILIQPNAGLPVQDLGRWVYPQTPEFFSSYASSLLEAGATLLGGCCGTTPDHIRALRRVVDGVEQGLGLKAEV
jgi:5-methyltetrahydrofolate--homocysteine methyltransferase